MVPYCYWQYLVSSFHVLSFLPSLERTPCFAQKMLFWVVDSILDLENGLDLSTCRGSWVPVRNSDVSSAYWLMWTNVGRSSRGEVAGWHWGISGVTTEVECWMRRPQWRCWQSGWLIDVDESRTRRWGWRGWHWGINWLVKRLNFMMSSIFF